jgi:intracellular multiplication protein IcmO
MLTEPIGGKQDTIYLLMVAAGLASIFPPVAGWVDHPIAFDLAERLVGGVIAPSLYKFTSLLTHTGLIASAAFGSYKLTYAALAKHRREFILPTSCEVESSDPPAYKKGTPGLLLGYTTDDGSPLYISDDDLCRHGIIVGQTGMGKSVFGKTLMFQQIQRGGGLLFTDGKLDEDNIQDIYEYAVFCGRGHDFLVVNPGRPEKSNTYNPILYGDPDEVAARIISLIPTANSAGADFYKQSANLALVCFISALQEATSPAQVTEWEHYLKEKGLPTTHVDSNRVTGLAYNFMDLALLTMNEGVLNHLMERVNQSSPDSSIRKNLAIFLEQYAKENNFGGGGAKPGEPIQIDLKRLKETLGGIGARMHQFGSGKFGPVLNSYSPEVRLYDAIRDNKIVYVALPTMGKDVAAQNLGKIVVADLRTAISWLQMNKQDRPKIPFLAFMDEMSSYSTETLAVMFEQARSARVALLPAIQTDSGLSNISEDFKERIMANTEIKIFFKLSSQATAETASEAIGMTRRVATSETDSAGTSASAQAMNIGPNKNLSDSSSSASGQREQEEPLVHADQIKSLEAGECIVLRSPRVWNIRIPLIELEPETKKAIGPLQINHSKNHVAEVNTFGGLKNVDKYLKEAQERRASKPKKDGGNSTPIKSVREVFNSADDLPTDEE